MLRRAHVLHLLTGTAMSSLCVLGVYRGVTDDLPWREAGTLAALGGIGGIGSICEVVRTRPRQSDGPRK